MTDDAGKSSKLAEALAKVQAAAAEHNRSIADLETTARRELAGAGVVSGASAEWLELLEEKRQAFIALAQDAQRRDLSVGLARQRRQSGGAGGADSAARGL